MVARRDVFVGRERELADLERALDAARDGSGATVLVAGEAGIGKTRLVCELGRLARAAGCEVLLGRSIDLVGTELPYQPFVEALRPLGDARRVVAETPGSQLQVFEQTLARLTERATSSPVLLVLEDLHWADISTLDLVVFLAHNLDDRRVLQLATYRGDEPASADRMRRLAERARRSGSADVIELGPLEAEAMARLLATYADAPLRRGLTDAIIARSEGSPFFAEELIDAADDPNSALPTGLRDLLLQRVARLDRTTQDLLQLAAVAGRDVGYPLLRGAAHVPEPTVRESLRQAVEHGVLVADQAGGSFRFRHALLAEAIYATILPGEREELHARLADELARSGEAGAAELAPHWAVAGRTTEAFVASIEAARQAEAVFGLAEAVAHLERALTLWDTVPDADELLQTDLAGLSAWTAELASQTGAAPRAIELAQRAIDLVEHDDPLRAARLYDHLGRYLHESGRTAAALSAFEHVVELVPAQPPSPQRADALAALATGLMLAWRFDESLAVCEQALELARTVGDQEAELRALMDSGRDLAYVGQADAGLAQLWRALELAEQRGDPLALLQAYVSLTDVLTMLARPAESVRVGGRGLDVVRRFGIDSTMLGANYIEALHAVGDWDKADSEGTAALRAITANFPYVLLMVRADLEVGRGEFDAARTHLESALATLREDRGQGIYDGYVAELALWERRWTDADRAVEDGMARAKSRQAAQLRVWFCTKGLRAHAELAALARARRDTDAVRAWIARAHSLIVLGRRAAKEAAAVTPNAAAWLALAEAEYQRARGSPRSECWFAAAETWDRLERPPMAAYCRWREAEALIASGASRADASLPLRAAHAVAARLPAKPLLREIELLAQRARLDLAEPGASAPGHEHSLENVLGLTAREAEVLNLVARGYTNREIAATLFISAKTASVHVSHILHKLDAPNRLEAAAIAHRLASAQGDKPSDQRLTVPRM